MHPTRTTRTTRTLLIALSAASLAACAGSRPLWVVGDEAAWELPLVDADGGPELLVNVHIGDQGPYLFLLNPDARHTTIDDSLAQQLGVYPLANDWRHLVSQDDRLVRRRAYEITGLRAGDLAFRTFGAMSFPRGAFDVRGHKISGVLGGGIFTDQIAIEVNRDAGLVRLSKPGQVRIPAGAIAVKGRVFAGRLFVPATVDGSRIELQVDLGRSSSVWPHVARSLNLPSAPVADSYVDDTGTSRHRTRGVTVDSLTIGGVESSTNSLVSLWQAGWIEDDVQGHGILGRDTLSQFHIVIDRHGNTLWLAPRRPDAG